MPSHPRSAWTRLGELLHRRRIEMDNRYRNRRTFEAERAAGLYRIINDIELGGRDNYEPGTISALEAAYDIAPGAIGRVLDGGELDPLAVTRDTAAASDGITVLRGDDPGLPPLPDLSPDDAGSLEPYLTGVYRDLYRAAGIDYGPHQEVPELPAQLLRVLEMVPGARIFSAEHEQLTWNTDVLDTPRKLRFIADVRRAVAGSRHQGRNTG